MSTPKSSLIIQRYDGFGGNFIDSDYLAASFTTKGPEMLDKTLMKIYASDNRFFTSKLFTALTGMAKGAPREIETETFRWMLQGAEERHAIAMELIEDGNMAPGLNNTTFRVKLDLDYFMEPDVLFGEDNEYPLAIVGNGIPDGNGTIYTVRIQGDDPTVFFPPALLQPGRRFHKVWTSVASELTYVELPMLVTA